MPPSATLGVFVAATVTLILILEPSTFYVLGRGITASCRVAFAAGRGIETGSALFVCLTAFGLSALIASTSYAFMTLHYLGAAYLLFLAVRALGLLADTEYAFLSGSVGRVLVGRHTFLRIRGRVEATTYVGLAAWSLASVSGTSRS